MPIVAAIAASQLTDAARKGIKELLPQGTTLADASTWPDRVGRKIVDMNPYHYVNLPKDANRYHQQRDCKLCNCIIEAVSWYMQVLKSPDAPRNEKRTALRFIAHLITDIHQPLHAAFAEDRGGNRIDVRFNGRKKSLHSLWDTALVELEQGTPAEIAERNQAPASSDELQQWQQWSPADWALEPLTIVRAQVYRLPASGEINATYVESARRVTRTRLGSAGSEAGVADFPSNE
jgi:nuclease S1